MKVHLYWLLPLFLAMSCSGGCAGTSQVIKDDASKAVDCIGPAIATLGACLDTAHPSPGMCAFNAAVQLISCVAAHPAVPHATPAPAVPTALYLRESDTLQWVAQVPTYSATERPYSLPRSRCPGLKYVGQPMRGLSLPRRLE